MKLIRLVFVIICFSIISTLFISSTIALEDNEASVSVYWLNQPINQGNIETVTIFFVNNSPEELQIFLVGLHFDWMESDQFVGNNLSNNPVIVPSSETFTFASSICRSSAASKGVATYLTGRPMTWCTAPFSSRALSVR